MDEQIETEESSQSSFSELKHHCLQLLELLQNPRSDSHNLSQLHRLLSRSPPHSLQPFFEYAFVLRAYIFMIIWVFGMFDEFLICDCLHLVEMMCNCV